MFTIKCLQKFVLFSITAIIFCWTTSVSAAAKPRSGQETLRDTYTRYLAKLETNSFGLPLFVESYERDDKVQVDIYGILAHPFSNVVNMLKVPANWCNIVPLYPNVKACTYSELPGARQLTFYLGKSVYQPPEDTRQVDFLYQNIAQQPGYLDLVLKAEDGPFGTKDHKIRVEALPIDGGKTFVHVSYAYSDSVALRLAAKVYFATLGHDKVGFTVSGTDSSGKPVYIGGPRGAVERNAVRCYFAIQSYMNTVHYPEESRFSMRINDWYDLTTRYRKQLLDLDKKDYLSFKTTEHKNQLHLQQKIGLTLTQ